MAVREKVGAVIVRDGNILSYGYNGTLPGTDNTCENNNKTKKDVVHAEINAIAKCARSTVSTDGAELYCTLSPCEECAKLIVQSGIIAVYYTKEYRDTSGLELLLKSKVKYGKI
jgi:dCMP deaminase